MIDLKTLAIIIILSASFGIASTTFLTDVYGKMYNKQIPKPFGCSFCMAFWGGLIYSIQFCNIFDSAMISCASAVLATIIQKHI